MWYSCSATTLSSAALSDLIERIAAWAPRIVVMIGTRLASAPLRIRTSSRRGTRPLGVLMTIAISLFLIMSSTLGLSLIHI